MCVDGGETLDRGRIESMSRPPLLLVESRKVIVCPSTAGGYFQQELDVNSIPLLSLQRREYYTHSADGAPAA